MRDPNLKSSYETELKAIQREAREKDCLDASDVEDAPTVTKQTVVSNPRQKPV